MKRVMAMPSVLCLFALALSGCADRNTVAAPSGAPGIDAAQTVTTTGAILPQLSATPTRSVSTVPANGDVNPYGVAFVPNAFAAGGGPLSAGDILVSNFNDSTNAQGTGTTIVRISGSGQQSLFFQGKHLGLTTALGVLRAGFVLVGNVESLTPKATCTQGASGPERGVSSGSLLIIDANGHTVATLDNKQFLNGPWDLAVQDHGSTAQVFVSNVLDGTVTRLDLAMNGSGVQVTGQTRVASGYVHRCDPAALVVGPTGLALDSTSGVLYVASAGDNAIYAVANATTTSGQTGKGTAVVTDAMHLHGPLGLARASNGDLISSQGDAVNPDPNQPSEIVEFTAQGAFVSQFSIDSAPGSAFGLALMQTSSGFTFAAVDDGLNVLDIWNR